MKITEKEIWIKGKDASIKEDVENMLSKLKDEYPGPYRVIAYAEDITAKCKLPYYKSLSIASIPLLEEKFGKENVVAREHEYEYKIPISNTKPTKKKQKPKDASIKLLKQAIKLLEEVNGKLDGITCQSASSIDSNIPETCQEPTVKAEP